MKQLALRLVEDRIPAGGDPVYLPATVRTLYLVEGDATMETALGATHKAQGSAWIGARAVAILPGREGARVLRWELAVPGGAEDGLLRAAPQCRSVVASAATIDLDPGFGWLMRCDRVGFPKGGIAYTHIHQGPGIRYCLEGGIRIESEGHVNTYGPGEAWFEIGSSPVLAPTSPDAETSFVRCFILPRSCKGRSSIRYVRPEDAAKPKVQRYLVLGERFIDLPSG